MIGAAFRSRNSFINLESIIFAEGIVREREDHYINELTCPIIYLYRGIDPTSWT
jgi:hypothetical protein